MENIPLLFVTHANALKFLYCILTFMVTTPCYQNSSLNSRGITINSRGITIKFKVRRMATQFVKYVKFIQYADHVFSR